ncbi:MAG: S41 family peptidase [Bacteroidota bacterium]
MELRILWLTILLPSMVFGQNQLSREQVLADYQILKNVLTEGYPSLFTYTSPSAWDSLFADFERNKIPSIQSNDDLYKSIAELSDHVRDGHLIIMRPQLDSIPNLFPLLLKIIDGNLYTDTDDFEIPLGSEIISIDGVSAIELRKSLMKYAPADGFNTSRKDRQLEREFGILHFYEFGAKSTYKIVYKTPLGQLLTKEVQSQAFESIGRRFAHRNSLKTKKAWGKKEPHLYFIDSLNTAVLIINTFNLGVESFQSALKEIFKEIKREKAKNLIIDIRQNEGGYPLNAINTFSFIADNTFKQIASSEVMCSTLPEKAYSQNLVNGYTYESFFEKYYQHAERVENRWVLRTDENEAFMVPNKKRFAGKVYVMIGGNTFSAGSSFALFCKNEGISLIGEETGGGYYTQTGGYPIIYTLPNSKIKVLISFVKINRFVKDKAFEKGHGILPDTEIRLTVQDLMEKRDSQLEFVLDQIRNE